MNYSKKYRALVSAALFVAMLFSAGFATSASAETCYGSGCYGYNYYPYGNYYGNYYGNQYSYNNQPPRCTITLQAVGYKQNYSSGNYPYNYYNYNYNYPYGYNYNNYYGAYPYNYNSGAVLSWSTSNAQSASISGMGSVDLNGSKVVYPSGNQIYTMTVNGPGGIYTCQTSYTYTGATYPTYTAPTTYATPTYTYPTATVYAPSTAVKSISLKQVPYTGADFGLAGTMLAWLSIVIAASIGAGVLAHRSGLAERAIARLRR